jgi:hypothetical protein
MVYRRTRDLEEANRVLAQQANASARACDFAAAQIRVARRIIAGLGHLVSLSEQATQAQVWLSATTWAEDAASSTHAEALSEAEKVPGAR